MHHRLLIIFLFCSLIGNTHNLTGVADYKNYGVINPLELAGDQALKEKNWDKAVKIFEILKDEHPGEADFWYKYGGALGMKALSVSKWESIGYLSKMKNAFETAVHLDPAHLGAYWALIHFHCEVPGILGGSQNKAENYARDLMHLSQADGLLAFAFLANHEKKYDRSHKLFVEATRFMEQKVYKEELQKVYNKISYKKKLNFDDFISLIHYSYRPDNTFQSIKKGVGLATH